MTTTTPAICSYCGATFTLGNPANSTGHCWDASACVRRKWAQEEAEKKREAKGG